MRILISGSTGFIGNSLVEHLQLNGHTIVRLVRSSGHPGILWDPHKRTVNRSRLEGFDAFVNLSGETIVGRWTADKKKKILESRIETTSFLVDCILGLKHRPKAYISASAIGYYGDKGDEEITELSPPGNDFLADVCVKWEHESNSLLKEGIRVAHMRTGLVLSPKGGALKKLLLPFKLGLGGPVGSGRQWWSWIDYDDQIRAYEYAITNDKVFGPVNGTAPNPVRNKEFVKTLGKVLFRPAIIPLPTPAVKLILGEMGDSLLLSSQKVHPDVLKIEGFEFKHPELKESLHHLLY